MKHQLLIYLIFLRVYFIQSVEVTPRNAQYCAFVANKIFCYGGSPGDKHYDNGIFSLDIDNLPPGPVPSFLNRWESITVQLNNPVAAEYRYDSGFVSLPDGVSMFLEGGSNDNFNKIANKTVAYNASSNTWHTFPDFYDAKNGGNRQIYASASVYLPKMNSIGFYGGKEHQRDIKLAYVTENGTRFPTNLTITDKSEHDPSVILTDTFIGFYYFTLFNLTSNIWKTIAVEPLQYNKGPFLACHQTGTYHPATEKIYYLGGFFHDVYTDYDGPISFSFSVAYDTKAASWENVTLKTPPNQNFPTPRKLHTATLLNTKNDVLIYGGTDLEEDSHPLPLMDYIYTLDLTTFMWTFHDIKPTTEDSGPRFYHSAVLINETSLFILFGVPKDKPITNSMLVLDVRNASSPVFSESYPLKSLDSIEKITNTSNEEKPKRISAGGIAGIVIGAIALVLIALGIFLCIRKKRKAEKAEKMEELEVDWDNIDIAYREEPAILSTYYEDASSPGTTVVSAPHAIDTTVHHKPIRKSMYSPALSPELNLTKPDGIDESIKNM